MNPIRFIVLFCITLSLLEAKIIEHNRINPIIIEIFQTFRSIYTPEEEESFASLNPYDITKATTILNKLAQKYFLRPAHLSRLQPPELTEYYIKTLFKDVAKDQIDTIRKKIYALFEKAGYIDPVYPTCRTPQNILILGATMMVIWKRIAFLNELVRTGKIILSETTTITLCIGHRIIENYEQEDLQKLHTDNNHTITEPFINEIEGGKSLIEIFPFCNDIRRESI
jgi:hypothetical protein